MLHLLILWYNTLLKFITCHLFSLIELRIPTMLTRNMQPCHQLQYSRRFYFNKTQRHSGGQHIQHMCGVVPTGKNASYTQQWCYDSCHLSSYDTITYEQVHTCPYTHMHARPPPTHTHTTLHTNPYAQNLMQHKTFTLPVTHSLSLSHTARVLWAERYMDS